MTRYFSLPTSSTSHTKEAREMKGDLPKASETGGEKSIGLEGETVATQPGAGASPPSTATTPTKTHNKLRKPRPFSLSVPSSKKRPKSASSSSAASSPRPVSVTMPLRNDSSSEESVSTLATPPTTPSKVRTESKPRLRTFSLRSVRSISASMIHHSHSASTSTTSSAQSSKSIVSSSGSVSSASTSPSVSPMKKVTSRVKKSIRRFGSSLHLPHVTSPKSRPRSSSTSSAPSFDHHHPPSHTPSPSSSSIPSASAAHSRKSSVSQDFTSVKTKEVQFINVNDEHEAKDEHERIPESIPERTSEELDQYNSVSETQPSSEPEPAVVESSPTAAITLGDSDEPLRVQVLESSTIVSTVLSPVAEMPTPITPQVPVPSAAETGDMQPEDVLPVSGPTLSTTAYVEQEVPDPFLVDEEGDAMSDETREEREQDRGASVAPSAASSEPLVAQEIALSVSTTTETTADATSPVASEPLLSPLNVNKDVPPTPPEETEQGEGQEEEEVLDLFLPGLIIPTMLLPIPNTDPLTTLLTKYIYPPEKRPMRDVTGEWKRTDVHTLVMTNSWRALGRMARDRIVAANPADVENILELWYLRLASLARLRLSNQTAAECTNLFLVLNAIEPKEHRHYVFEKILPFELEIMHARIKYWSGDHMGYLDALSALLTKCKRKAREAVAISRSEGEAQEIKEMWKERGARISLILASQLVEMKDFTAATRLLEPLCTQRPHNSRESTITNPTLRSAIARIFIQGGNVQLAAHHFGIVAQDPTADESLKRLNEAILCAAEGEWDRSVELLKGLIEEDEDNFVAVNDLSVTLLSQGKLKEAIEVLEKALSSSPSTVVVAEPILFNLSTLYELRSAAGLEKKKGLLIEVAKWSGDGLRTNCLKMLTS